MYNPIRDLLCMKILMSTFTSKSALSWPRTSGTIKCAAPTVLKRVCFGLYLQFYDMPMTNLLEFTPSGPSLRQSPDGSGEALGITSSREVDQ